MVIPEPGSACTGDSKIGYIAEDAPRPKGIGGTKEEPPASTGEAGGVRSVPVDSTVVSVLTPLTDAVKATYHLYDDPSRDNDSRGSARAKYVALWEAFTVTQLRDVNEGEG